MEAVSILGKHGGQYQWKFGDWTFTPIEVRSNLTLPAQDVIWCSW